MTITGNFIDWREEREILSTIDFVHCPIEKYLSQTIILPSQRGSNFTKR